MRITFGLLAGISAVATMVAQDAASARGSEAAAAARSPTPREPLRVLYAGQPDHPRTEEFVRFLGEHFAATTAIDVRSLGAQSAADFDVVVVDLPADCAHARAVRLPEGFDRPTVLVGMWPARFAEAAGLKISDG